MRPKFVHIATVMSGNYVHIYALDEGGTVWWMNRSTREWEPMPTKCKGDRHD